MSIVGLRQVSPASACLAVVPRVASALLVDLDGTLRLGGRWCLGAERLLERGGERIVVLSNDSEHLPEELSARFTGWGRPLAPERFVLAGATAMEVLAAEMAGRETRVLWLGSPALAGYGARLGLTFVEEDPDIVLVGRDRSLTFDRLERAVTAVTSGARLVACNGDLTHPGADGRRVPETGMIVAAIRAGAGDAPCRCIGKPEPLLFDMALRRLGASASDALMVGDNPATDGAGARRAGIRFLDAAALPALDVG